MKPVFKLRYLTIYNSQRRCFMSIYCKCKCVFAKLNELKVMQHTSTNYFVGFRFNKEIYCGLSQKRGFVLISRLISFSRRTQLCTVSCFCSCLNINKVDEILQLERNIQVTLTSCAPTHSLHGGPIMRTWAPRFLF